MTEYGLLDSMCSKMKAEIRNGVYGGAVASGQEGKGFMLTYPVIDVQETGKQLRRTCDQKRVSPKELQEFLGLAALQSVYSWFQGRALPSLDNFYALSCYLGTRMEELVVTQGRSREVLVRGAAGGLKRRQMAYYGFLVEAGRCVPAGVQVSS